MMYSCVDVADEEAFEADRDCDAGANACVVVVDRLHASSATAYFDIIAMINAFVVSSSTQ